MGPRLSYCGWFWKVEHYCTYLGSGRRLAGRFSLQSAGIQKGLLLGGGWSTPGKKCFQAKVSASSSMNTTCDREVGVDAPFFLIGRLAWRIFLGRLDGLASRGNHILIVALFSALPPIHARSFEFPTRCCCHAINVMASLWLSQVVIPFAFLVAAPFPARFCQ